MLSLAPPLSLEVYVLYVCPQPSCTCSYILLYLCSISPSHYSLSLYVCVYLYMYAFCLSPVCFCTFCLYILTLSPLSLLKSMFSSSTLLHTCSYMVIVSVPSLHVLLTLPVYVCLLSLDIWLCLPVFVPSVCVSSLSLSLSLCTH